MKQLSLVLLLFFLCSGSDISAQSKWSRKLENKVKRRADRRAEKAMDKGLDKIEEEIDGAIEGEDEGENKEKDSKPTDKEKEDGSSSKTNKDSKESPALRAYSGFSFEEGVHTIFEFAGESEYGEFPSKFGLISGSAENAKFGEDDVISFVERFTVIYPLMETEDYLPESWTMVFDAYFYNQGNEACTVQFPGARGGGITLRDDRAGYNSFKGSAKEGRGASHKAGWRHYSISFNKRALKVYIDQSRVLNIPNVDAKFTKIAIKALSPSASANGTSVIKNIRIAEGGENLYNQLLTDSKIVTNDILFQVNKAVLLPESTGIINSIVGMMKKKPEVKFTVVGHTDSDGDVGHNQQLSEERAAAVKKEMIKRGIEASRLRSEGKGELSPLASNNSKEGKAQNRRVEFIRF